VQLRATLALGFCIAGCGLTVSGSPDDASSSTDTPPSLPGDGAAPPSSSSPSTDEGGVQAGAADSSSDAPVVKEALCPQRADLVACFGFDGNAVDGSNLRTALMASDSVTFPSNGRENQAVRLTLSPKSNIRFPFKQFLNTNKATIEMWFRPETLASGGRTLLVDMDGRFGVIIESDATIHCRSIAATTKAKAGTWTHVACVNDGATMTAYVNGVAEASGSNTLGTTADWVGIGQDSTSGNDNFDGMIDNLRFWSEARTPAEVAAAAAR
jgi:hypothetical protein